MKADVMVGGIMLARQIGISRYATIRIGPPGTE